MPFRRAIRIAIVSAGLSACTASPAAVASGAQPTAAMLAEPATTVRFSSEADAALSESDKEAIRTITAQAHADVLRLLPQVPPDMALQVGVGGAVIPETGEGGASLQPGLVAWTLDPAHPGGAAAVIAAHLRTTLFHEFHHQARGWNMANGGGATSIMDAVVAEGMASVFARDAAGARVPWAAAPDEPEAWLADIEGNGRLEQYMQWMFAHPDGRRWIGYRTGVYVVDRAIAASGRDAAALVDTPTAEVLALARGG